jgi:DNA-binding NtrC family response regulator
MFANSRIGSVERAIIMADGTTHTAADVDLPAPDVGSTSGKLKIDMPEEGISLEEVEIQLIIQALERCGWIQKDAAKLLRLSKRILNCKIGKHGISYPTWRKHV